MILLQPDPGIQYILYDLGPFGVAAASVIGILIMMAVVNARNGRR